MRIAAWSGPRNISTAMMRSFRARPDCAVVDEPLYAAYLTDTGKQHPMREAVLASQPTDWREAASALVGPIPRGRDHWYQKHMAHHMLPDRLGPWLAELRHLFLVRDPAEMVSSLLAAWPEAELEDTGLPQQVALMDWIRSHTDQRPVLLDGRSVLDDPEGSLQSLCAALGLPWESAMLAWEPGPRPEDGAWASHWYAGVWRSTGFRPWTPRPLDIPDAKRHLVDQGLRLLDDLRTRAAQ